MRLPRAVLTGALVLLTSLWGVSLPPVQNALVEIRVVTAGQALARALSRARSSAIARNQRVQFQLDRRGGMAILTELDGQALAVDNDATGQQQLDIAVTPHGAHMATFNGLGWSVGNIDGSPSIHSVEVHADVLPGGAHPSRRITLTAAGSVTLCDPDVRGDTRLACAQAGEYRASGLIIAYPHHFQESAPCLWSSSIKKVEWENPPSPATWPPSAPARVCARW